MKKLLAFLTAFAMVMSFSIMAFAEDEEPIQELKLQKLYLETDGDMPDTFPEETLQFTVAAGEENPDGAMIEVQDLTVQSNPDQVVITMPEFTKAGKYTYTLQEVAGSTQGVTYYTEPITVQIQVSWDGSELEPTAVFAENGGGQKIDTIVNRYDLGDLDVEKEVTGNMGDRDQEFLVDVVFTAQDDKQIRSAITYEDEDGTVSTITPADLADGTELVTITLKHDEEVEFDNIPVGVTYQVKEHDYTGEGYDVPVYEVNDAEPVTSADGVTGTILEDDDEDQDDQDVDIINNKGAVVETGVFMDSAPYILLLAAAILGIALLFGRKRHMA